MTCEDNLDKMLTDEKLKFDRRLKSAMKNFIVDKMILEWKRISNDE